MGSLRSLRRDSKIQVPSENETSTVYDSADRHLWIFGGVPPVNPVNGLWKYDWDSNSWEEVKGVCSV